MGPSRVDKGNGCEALLMSASDRALQQDVHRRTWELDDDNHAFPNSTRGLLIDPEARSAIGPNDRAHRTKRCWQVQLARISEDGPDDGIAVTSFVHRTKRCSGVEPALRTEADAGDELSYRCRAGRRCGERLCCTTGPRRRRFARIRGGIGPGAETGSGNWKRWGISMTLDAREREAPVGVSSVTHLVCWEHRVSHAHRLLQSLRASWQDA